MFSATKLSEQNGARKFGSCISCGKGSSEDPDMILIKFQDRHGGAVTSLVLCQECAMRVANGLAKQKDKESNNA